MALGPGLPDVSGRPGPGNKFQSQFIS